MCMGYVCMNTSYVYTCTRVTNSNSRQIRSAGRRHSHQESSALTEFTRGADQTKQPFLSTTSFRSRATTTAATSSEATNGLIKKQFTNFPLGTGGRRQGGFGLTHPGVCERAVGWVRE